MTIDVREFRPEDAKGVAEVRRAALPYMVWRPESVLWEAERTPAAQRLRMLVAEVDGQVVGATEARLVQESSLPGQGHAVPVVRPEYRGQGIGSALLSAAEQYLLTVGCDALYVWVSDDGHSPGFAERRGYRRRRAARFLQRDLTEPLPVPPPLPAGARLRTAAGYDADPRPLYEADRECTLDEPGDVPAGPLRYEDWLAVCWGRPEWDRELTSVVVVDGAVAAYSVAHTDGCDRYWSGMTGTRRAFRGRGLAKIAKHDSLTRSRAAGYTHAFTGNDAENEPMLAINQWFGYRPAAREWRYAKEL
ncbi:GNAT family N-acetyltransferase [Streptomyces gobiensis]|uniref:GNAT family N-acetyltransferase n=1 Tax=Streptomyces gobiensis TaxID=2875706 RepID=UPI001E4CC3FD|nr:GNAT family N-acetyltransferase [Streptomyces gobiensis]UGY90574.1 GNAT family N-acetyltransferase [Streptomyces gobiensis]